VLSVASQETVSRLLSEFGQFDMFVKVLQLVPTELPFQHGATFAEFFAYFVPRALWPDKPLPIEYRISLLSGSNASGKPASILGELYLNGGALAIVVGMILFGVLARMAHESMLRQDGNPAVVLLYSYSVANLHRFFTRSFAPKLFGFLLFMVPAGLALWVITTPRKGLSQPAEG
jgi:oligosaccharide repeat unit polymerase